MTTGEKQLSADGAAVREMGGLRDCDAEAPVRTKRPRNAVVFAIIVVLWVVFDRLTKVYFEAFELGEPDVAAIPSVLGFRLVHNTGGAWGVLGDMTFVLAALSVVVCAVAAIYLFVLAPNSSLLMAVGISLVFAGGVGNLTDRLAYGYVIDFIEPLFIEFPVFNIADIGVTVGVALVLLAMALDWAREVRDVRQTQQAKRRG